mgnify:CR=1 FL=1
MLRKTLLWLICGVAGYVLAEDAEEAEIEFLEYLVLWVESVEVWVMIERQLNLETDERIDPAPNGEESTETDDER